MDAEKKRKKGEENAKTVHHGVGVGGGWKVVEGKTMRMVEVTTHFTTPLTKEEKKSLPEKIRMVSNLVGVKRRAEGLGMWNIEAAINTQVCQNEITWRVSKVVRGTTEVEVSVQLGTQATIVYGEERLKGASVTNRKMIAVFVRGLREGKDDKKEELQGKLELKNPGIKWGNRSVVITNVSSFLLEMKAEVISAEGAVALIGKGVWWDGKKYEAELWKNARPRASGGSQEAGRGSPPSGPGGSRCIGGGYGRFGPGTLGQSMDYRVSAATTAEGSDIMREPVLYTAGTQADTSERGAIRDRGDQQVPWGTHQKDQGRGTH